jgi:LAGLIDADG endonuclease
VTKRQVRTISRKDSGPVLDVEAIPESIGQYLAGFTNGEGSFNVSFRPRRDYSRTWKTSLCFNVSQRDELILRLFARHLGCGTMRQRPDGVWYLEVNNLRDINSNVLPFFERFGFLSEKKQKDFDKFRAIAELMTQGAHLTPDGVRAILEIRRDMNDGGKRRHEEREILRGFPLGESSETVRRTHVTKGMR